MPAPKQHAKVVRKNLYARIPASLMERVKLEALQKGVSIQEVVEKALDKTLPHAKVMREGKRG